MLGQDGRIREHIRGEGAAPAPRLATPLDALTPRAPSLAILTPCFFPPRAAAPEWSQCLWGGGERYLVDLSHLFKDLGYDVHLFQPVSYTHLRAHETVLDLVCRLLLEKKKKKHNNI